MVRYMEGRKGWRRLFTVLSSLGFVVMALNLERLSEYLGIDRTLVDAYTDLPVWVATVVSWLTSPAAIFISSIVIAYTLGLWTEAIARYWMVERRKPFDREGFADQCVQLSSIVRANAEFFGAGKKQPPHITYLQLDSWTVEDIFRNRLDTVVKLSPRDKEDAITTADFLADVVPLIREGDTDAIQRRADGFKTARRALLSPQDTAEETPQ